MGMLDGRVAICTGAGRGVGAEVAKLMAANGASVLVNDPGVTGDGQGADQSPAQTVVDEIKAAGGQGNDFWIYDLRFWTLHFVRGQVLDFRIITH